MSAIPKTQLVSLFETTGSLDVLKTAKIASPQIAAANDIIIKNKYAGVNFIDSYLRKGLYPSPELPFTLGQESSGVVVAIGDEVTNFKVGDNVAYIAPKAFAQYTKLTDKSKLVKLDDNLSEDEFKIYGGALLQGLTALTFISESYNVKKDDFILVWAASGGTGSILVQLASQRGAKVIAIASTSEKLAKTKELGAQFTINYKTEDVAARVKEITNGQGVAAVYDSVGKVSFDISLESLTRKGTFVSFGNASGMVPPLVITRLSAKNIVFVRPRVLGYVETPQEWDHYTGILLNALQSGDLKLDISAVYPLSEFSKATEALESGKTSGKLIIEIPQ
ncbi:NADPH:quinone reductase [Scheffersomyces coipomensis]|uniref:NADPH:quinone reductase n=1 Tax=Scheffersomyces coipomensis TaxID=1788519 RepID=UPI00315D6AD1